MGSISPQDVWCLVLCAGRGTRMQPLTYTRPKQLLPLCNRPLIDWILDDIFAAGLRRVCWVTDPEAHALEGHVRRNAPAGLEFQWVKQKQPLGIAHAVRQTEGVVGENPFIVYLGDALYEQGIGAFVERFCREYPRALLRVTEVGTPAHYGTVGFDSSLRIDDAREKDPNTPWKHAITGLYAFPPSFYRALENMRPGIGGEFQITDVIRAFLQDPRGEYGAAYDGVYAEVYAGRWTDAGRPSVFIRANADLFNRAIERAHKTGAEVIQTETGRVIMGERCELRGDNILKGDIVVGAGCSLHQAHLAGPCAVNDGTVIAGTAVETSIIDREAVLTGEGGQVVQSIVGIGAQIKGEGPWRLEGAVVADQSRIVFHQGD